MATRTQPRHAKGSKKGGQFKPNWFGRKPPTPQDEKVKAQPPPGASSARVGGHSADPSQDSEGYMPPPSAHPHAPSEWAGGTRMTSEEFGEALTWALPDGTLHRVDGPAVIKKDGTKMWYYNGIRHRADGPAITTVNKSQEWHVNGVLHREDGPAVLISPADGDDEGWYEAWYSNGVIHRKGGPAVTLPDGTQMWFKNGKLSRWFGPAIIHGDGRKEWCGVGKFIRATAIGLIVMKIFTSRL